jgi:hypothetical protein
MNKGGQCMRGGAEALEGRDPGGSWRAQGNLPPNQTGSPSFFLFLFSFLSIFVFDREGAIGGVVCGGPVVWWLPSRVFARGGRWPDSGTAVAKLG